jgi:hypothetical protein
MNETNISKYVTDHDPLDQIVSKVHFILIENSTGKQRRFSSNRNPKESKSRKKQHGQYRKKERDKSKQE